jgi:LysM repeat protein
VIEEGRLQLVMREIQPELVDLSGPVTEANHLLAQPVAIRAYDPITNETLTWEIDADVWSTWLSLDVQTGDGAARLNWSLDQSQARAYLTEQAGGLGPERYLDLDAAVAAMTAALTSGDWPVRLSIRHQPQQHTVRPGETLSSIGYDYGIPYPWIAQANPNLGDRLAPGQTITIPSPNELLPLPAVENKRLVVSLSEQKMWAYENGTVKWEWPVSTGIASSPTAPGLFQVQSHEPNAYAANWNLWMPNFIGIYRPVPTSDFMNGFHGFPTRNGSTLLWTDDLGRRVTYGCILISSDNAAKLYDWASPGVIVEVKK